MNEHYLINNCPTCKKIIEYSTTNKFRPFCSKRCKLIDLGDWADAANRIPSASSNEFKEKDPPLNN